ncbi:MAG: MFS transporter [Anaeromyxobacter sp.]
MPPLVGARRHPVAALRRLPSALLSGLALLAAAPAHGLLAAAPLVGGGRLDGPASRLRRSLRASTLEGIGAELITACVGPTLLTAWALHLGCTPLEVGSLAALPQLAQVVQLPAAWVTALFGRRRVAVLTVAVGRESFLPLALLPFLDLAPQTARWLLMVVAASSAVVGVLGNNAWTAWMGELVPERLRGRYFGRRTALCTLGSVLAGVGTARLLDLLTTRRDAGFALAALAALACLTGLFTTGCMLRQHDRPTPRQVPSLRSALAPLRDPAARPLFVYQLCWNASVGLAGAFFVLHLLRNLRLGFTVVALQAATAALVKVLAAPLWGKAIDRFGARPVLAACSFGAAVLPLCWLAATPAFPWPIAADALVGGIAWSGHALASFAMPLAVAPRRDRSFYLATFAMAGGGAYALGTLLGGSLATALPPAVARLGLPGGHGLELLFVLSTAGRFLSGFLALRIAERGAGSLTQLHDAARGAALGALAGAAVRVTGRGSRAA